MFSIRAAPSSVVAVRFVIRKTFGASRTYLNQIFLMESLCPSRSSPKQNATLAEVHNQKPEMLVGNTEERQESESARATKIIQHDMRRFIHMSNRPSTSFGLPARESRNSYSTSPGPLSSRFSKHSESEPTGIVLANKLQAMQQTIASLCKQTKEKQTQLSNLQRSLQEGESVRNAEGRECHSLTSSATNDSANQYKRKRLEKSVPQSQEGVAPDAANSKSD